MRGFDINVESVQFRVIPHDTMEGVFHVRSGDSSLMFVQMDAEGRWRKVDPEKMIFIEEERDSLVDQIGEKIIRAYE